VISFVLTRLPKTESFYGKIDPESLAVLFIGENFQTLESNRDYGNKLSAKLGNKSFVIDTSRNGLGPDAQGEWCNPRSRALGTVPTLNPWPWVDALLWIKRPGESDGSCNGGPGAGQWWREMALELARGAGL